ncbi:YeeE/YedE thiosulfate transporter family protein [Clostridium sp. BL-8]|uniref:YeeE/YedE thiosulfate transporter family protein n=1 Tax=Clostridium sp. BL-8 TaxID=349938 RepID=UPI00098BD60D|nr:YeeE/YedE thiosulfate transporter family protein [Clostridium sp. BL-8]OOM78977.1 putative inner membrane protein [Clostridium sp. BL-8]
MAELKTNISRKPRKKKVNQIPFGIVLFIAIIGVGFFIANNSPRSALMWMLGILAGFTLQRSRFCFTASLRDPLLTGGTSLTKAVIIAIAIASAGFAAIQFSAASKGAAIPGNISPVGIHVIVGAVLFGIGMVIAGGCASGTLMRVGEGFLMQIISLVFFIVGSLWGAKDFGWWSKNFMPAKGVFLPELIGWVPAIFLQFALLLGIYILADWYGNRKTDKD